MALVQWVDSYCTVADVQRKMKLRNIGDASTVTTLDVEYFVKFRFSEINAALDRAGYLTPVTQGVDTLEIGTQLQVNAAIAVDGTSVVLKDSGGSLTGYAKSGDTLIFTGDSQVYVVTARNTASGNLLLVGFRPQLIQALTEDQVVTWAAVDNAQDTLIELNAIGAAADALDSGFSAGGATKAPQAEALSKRFEMLLEKIEKGNIVLIGAERREATSVSGTMRVGRRG